MAKQNNTKVVTGIVRLSYANVWEPKSINGGDPKYSCSIIIPKSDIETVNAINAAIECAMKEGIGKFGGKIPPKGALKLPLRDGDIDRPDDPNYAGAYFVNANSNERPGVVDRRRVPSPTRWRCTPAAMSGHPSPSIPSTPTATAASPADCRTSRSGATASR